MTEHSHSLRLGATPLANAAQVGEYFGTPTHKAAQSAILLGAEGYTIGSKIGQLVHFAGNKITGRLALNVLAYQLSTERTATLPAEEIAAEIPLPEPQAAELQIDPTLAFNIGMHMLRFATSNDVNRTGHRIRIYEGTQNDLHASKARAKFKLYKAKSGLIEAKTPDLIIPRKRRIKI